LFKQQPSEVNPRTISRRHVLQTGILGVAGAALSSNAPAHALASADDASSVKPFAFDEATISDLQARMKSGEISAQLLTQAYIERINAIDKAGLGVNSVIELNPDAISIAEALDKERKEKGPRGPMHGIPVLLKDNIETSDRMQTTAGSLALVGSKPAQDSGVARKLREAGAVILGKTNLSEWANIRSSHSTSGCSGRGGLTKNP